MNRQGIPAISPARRRHQENMLFLRKKSKPETEERTEILTATLHGHGRREPCLVYAVRITDASGAPPALKDFRVRDLPGGLDDGDYTIELNGLTLTLRVDRGRWTLLEPVAPSVSMRPSTAG